MAIQGVQHNGPPLNISSPSNARFNAKEQLSDASFNGSVTSATTMKDIPKRFIDMPLGQVLNRLAGDDRKSTGAKAQKPRGRPPSTQTQIVSHLQSQANLGEQSGNKRERRSSKRDATTKTDRNTYLSDDILASSSSDDNKIGKSQKKREKKRDEKKGPSE